jgi:uncharacterized protein (TIGR02231 family)
MKQTYLALAIALSGLSCSVWADSVQGAIAAVTVYPDSATVTRRLDVTLPAGDQFIDMVGLPQSVEPDTLQVTGFSRSGPRISSLEWLASPENMIDSPQLAALKKQKDDLEVQQGQLQAEQQAISTQQLFLQTMAKEGLGKSAQGNPAQQVQSGVQVLGSEMKQAGEAMASVTHRLALLASQLQTVNDALTQLRDKDASLRTVRIHLRSDGQPFQMNVQYRVLHARWQPIYDADLLTKSRQVALIQAALIQQNTGEDWHNVALTLSTAQPLQQAAAPDLPSQWVDVQDEERGSQPAVARSAMLEAKAAAPVALMSARQTDELAAIQSSAYHVRFVLASQTTLLADGQSHRVVLATQTSPVTLSLQAIPRLDPHAYLYGNVRNTTDQPWLAGHWQLSRDGEPVGQLDQPTLASQATVALGFGIDPAITLTWQSIQDEAGQGGLLSKTSVQKRKYRLQASNARTDGAELLVLDSWPVAKQSSIEVTPLDGTTPPAPVTTTQQPGVQRWTLALPSKQTVTLDTGYQITYPQGKTLRHYESYGEIER